MEKRDYALMSAVVAFVLCISLGDSKYGFDSSSEYFIPILIVATVCAWIAYFIWFLFE